VPSRLFRVPSSGFRVGPMHSHIAPCHFDPPANFPTLCSIDHRVLVVLLVLLVLVVPFSASTAMIENESVLRGSMADAFPLFSAFPPPSPVGVADGRGTSELALSWTN